MKEKICREIYREAFADEDKTFENLLFRECFQYCVSIDIGLSPISMLFALPCFFMEDVKKREAIYIYAAATFKECRGIGYMGELIETVKKMGKPVFLRPAESSLIEFYSRFGFETISAKKGGNIKLLPDGGYKSLTDIIGEDKSDDGFILMYYSNKKENFGTVDFPFSMN